MMGLNAGKNGNVTRYVTKVSVCIPLYLRTKADKEFLFQLLQTIQKQTFKDFEIVMSLDAKNPLGLDLIELPSSVLANCTIRLLLADCSGISANSNFAIHSARGQYIKVIFQDDLIAHDHVLDEIVRIFESTRRVWLVSASDHLDDSTKRTGPIIIPKPKKDLFAGVNTISSPSVVAFHSSVFLQFESSLSLMMDCEWYIRMIHNYGKPKILKKVAVVNRLHLNQTQHALKSTLQKERASLLKMHSKKSMRRTRCICKV